MRHALTSGLNSTSLLIEGTKDGGTTFKWFKVEITDENDEYFPIYRNFTYVVDVCFQKGNNKRRIFK